MLSSLWLCWTGLERLCEAKCLGEGTSVHKPASCGDLHLGSYQRKETRKPQEANCTSCSPKYDKKMVITLNSCGRKTQKGE